MRKLLLALLVLCCGLGVSDAAAQVALGPRLGLGLGDVEDPYLGLEARFDAPALPVQIRASGDYYFVEGDGVSLFHFTADGLYEFGIDNQLFTPYAGGGLSLAFTSVDDQEIGGVTIEGDSDTDLALHVTGGAVFELQTLRPFVQAEFTIGGDADLFGLTAGLLFSLGG